MSHYSCKLAEKIGRTYSLCPEQVQPDQLRSLAVHWHPRGRDLSRELNNAADRLERKLRRLGLWGQPVQADEDERAMTRSALSGNPTLLAEMKRGWSRRDRSSRSG